MSEPKLTPAEQAAFKAVTDLHHLQGVCNESLRLFSQYLSWTRRGGSSFSKDVLKHARKIVRSIPSPDPSASARVGLRLPSNS